MARFIEFKGTNGMYVLINIELINKVVPNNEGKASMLCFENGDYEVIDIPYSEVKALLNAETHLPAVPATPEKVDELGRFTKDELDHL